MKHTPVLLDECISGLCIKPDGIFLDGTLGRGGHAAEIARRLTKGKLIAIDRDETALKEAKERLGELCGKIIFVHANFCDVPDVLAELNIPEADGMLFDLGVSSPQLDDAERGFSYMNDNAPLDMRMDRSESLTAFEIVNTWTEEKLRGILYEYGEERYSGRIARAIVKKRADIPIKTAFDLNSIILGAIPPAARHEKQHPSKRSFQAIRITVNDELGAIKKMLGDAPDKLTRGGKICVISFHSLEDRLVKNAFASRERGCKCPSDFPKCICGFIPSLTVITKKPITPSKAEMENNPRSRSAKLRIAEKI